MRPATLCGRTRLKTIRAGISVNTEKAAVMPRSCRSWPHIRKAQSRVRFEIGKRGSQKILVPGERPGENERDGQAGHASGKIMLEMTFLGLTPST